MGSASGSLRASAHCCLIISKGMVQDRGIPYSLTSEEDMWKCIPFHVSVGVDVQTRKTIDDVKWDDITIKGGDALKTSNPDGLVIDIILEPFKLQFFTEI